MVNDMMSTNYGLNQTIRPLRCLRRRPRRHGQLRRREGVRRSLLCLLSLQLIPLVLILPNGHSPRHHAAAPRSGCGTRMHSDTLEGPSGHGERPDDRRLQVSAATTETVRQGRGDSGEQLQGDGAGGGDGAEGEKARPSTWLGH